jgi:NTE family protein
MEPVAGQSTSSARTALVLSAGGMFGAYQAGAWKALSAVIQPDVVVGTSVGALNAWCIAGGCSADDLIKQWMDPRMATLLRPRPPVPPWNGFFDPRHLERLAKDLCDRYPPRIPLVVTLTEVPGLRAHAFCGREITWRHLAATCAIPLCFPPVRLNGRHYLDGGLLGALPLWAAAEVDAARVIAVNALPRMPSPAIRLMVGALRQWRSAPAAPPDLEVRLIAPRAPLGSAADMLRWKPENIRRWIERGEQDTQARFH